MGHICPSEFHTISDQIIHPKCASDTPPNTSSGNLDQDGVSIRHVSSCRLSDKGLMTIEIMRKTGTKNSHLLARAEGLLDKKTNGVFVNPENGTNPNHTSQDGT